MNWRKMMDTSTTHSNATPPFKNFMAFLIEKYEPGGGMFDYQGSFHTMEAAIEKITTEATRNPKHKDDQVAHVWDITKEEMIWTKEFPSLPAQPEPRIRLNDIDSIFGR